MSRVDPRKTHQTAAGKAGTVKRGENVAGTREEPTVEQQELAMLFRLHQLLHEHEEVVVG